MWLSLGQVVTSSWMSLYNLCRTVTRGPVSVDLRGHFVNLLPLSELSLVHGQLFVVHGYNRPPNVFP
jgi:hypothetical protein